MLPFFTKKGGKGAPGFTLIELLVVIAIIGVLASIVLASLNNARRKSRDARRITDIKQIQLALELYFDGEGGTYPDASTTCDIGAGTFFGLQVLKTEGYIPQVPFDPLGSGTSGCYKYAAPSTDPQTTYHLGTALEDKANSALGGDSDAVDPATGWNGNFDGTSAPVSPAACNTTAGNPYTPAADDTETCYDVKP